MSTKHYWATVNIYGHNAIDVKNGDKINLFSDVVFYYYNKLLNGLKSRKSMFQYKP